MNSLSAIVLVTLLGVAVASPLLHKNGLHYKRLVKTPIKDFKSAIGGRVLNGSEAVAHSRPYEAYLEFESFFYGWICGGSLISENYILTAGHCVYEASSASVLLGAHNINQEESTAVTYTSNDFVLHKDFDEEYILFDIGLVKLSKSVTLTSAIQTIPLPSKSDVSKSYVGETVTISGWGLTSGDASNVSPVLMEVDVKVISYEDCTSFFDGVQEYQICTSGDDGKGSCNGDSGSPLIHNNVAIGVTSYGAYDCEPYYPSGFTSTGYFLDWIQENSDVSLA